MDSLVAQVLEDLPLNSGFNTSPDFGTLQLRNAPKSGDR